MTDGRTTGGHAALMLLGRWVRAKRGSIRAADIGLEPSRRALSEFITQFQAARRAGVSLRAWRDVETGRRPAGPRLLAGIIQALRLDEIEEAHLRRLAGAASSSTRPEASVPRELTEAVRSVVAGHDGPAYATDRRWRVVAVNSAVQDAAPGLSVGQNLLQWFFKNPQARLLLPDWEPLAVETVGLVRATQALHPHDTWYETAMARLAAADQTVERLWQRQEHIAPMRAVSTLRVRCPGGSVKELTATRMQLASLDSHDLQIVLMS